MFAPICDDTLSLSYARMPWFGTIECRETVLFKVHHVIPATYFHMYLPYFQKNMFTFKEIFHRHIKHNNINIYSTYCCPVDFLHYLLVHGVRFLISQHGLQHHTIIPEQGNLKLSEFKNQQSVGRRHQRMLDKWSVNFAFKVTKLSVCQTKNLLWNTRDGRFEDLVLAFTGVGHNIGQDLLLF